MNFKENAPMYLSLKRLLAIIIAGSILIGLAGCNVSAEEDPNGVVEVKKTSNDIIAENLPPTSEANLSAELLSDPEVLAENIMSIKTEWLNSGAIKRIYSLKADEESALGNNNFKLGSEEMTDFAYSVASQFDSIYIEALFGDSPTSNVSEFIEHNIALHGQTLDFWVQSAFGIEPEDKEGYAVIEKPIEVVSFKETDDGCVITILSEVDDNSEMNRVEEYVESGNTFDGEILETYTIIKDEDGNLKITDYTKH